MKRAIVQNNIVVKPSNIHGHGVFAKENFRKGEIIEVCYTLLASDKDEKLINFTFSSSKGSTIPLGFGCIYNHSPQPNATYDLDIEKMLMTFTAKRFIHKGEEIFTSYGKQWFDSRKIPLKEVSKLRRFFNVRASFPFRALIGVSGLWCAVQLVSHLGG